MSFWNRWLKRRSTRVVDPLARSFAALDATQHSEAQDVLATIAAADPDNGEAQLALGMLRLRDFTNDPASSVLHDAMISLRRAVERLPESSEAHFYLAIAESFTLDTVDEAAQHLARALELDPGLADRANDVQARIAEARSGMQQQALDADTLHAAVLHYEEGQHLIEQGDLTAAASAFNQAIALYPSYVEAIVALAEVERRRGNIEQAIAAFRRALAVRPDMFEARIGLGSLYVQQGDHARALAQLKLAAEQQPEQASLLRNIGLLQLALGTAQDALATFRRLAALQPDDPEAQLQVALAAAQAGDGAAARDALSRIDADTLQPRQHQLAAQIYDQLGNREAAQRHRDRAAERV